VAKAELARPTTNPAQYVTDGQNYWKRIQGTSMASPHATGVAALVVAENGRRDPKHGGLTLKPAKVERILRDQATDTACPEPRLFDYPEPNSGDQYTAYCEGTPDRNGFYGDGIVDAAAVGVKR
jgi:subtilisin family serine protease